jgi:F-type H+-transporting ATPase subunit b
VLINWFTVAAQIVNFLILAALLKRFLYGPIVRAMAAREERIASEMAVAVQKRQEAEQKDAAMTQKMQEIQVQRREMIAQAEREVETYKAKLFDQARQDVGHIQQKWAESLNREKDTFFQNLRQRLVQEILAISRRALREMADQDLEQRLFMVLLSRLQQMDPREQQIIRDSIKAAGGELLVTTAFELPQKTREEYAAQMKSHFGQDLALRFATSGELLAGIEIFTSSRKIAWSLGNFLDSLEEDLSQAFEELGGRGGA